MREVVKARRRRACAIRLFLSQRKKKAAWDVFRSPRSAAYTVFASRCGLVPQPLEASCLINRSTQHPAVSGKSRTSFPCSSTPHPAALRGGKLNPNTGVRCYPLSKKGGDLRTTTKAVDCRSHRSPPPKLLKYPATLVQRHPEAAGFPPSTAGVASARCRTPFKTPRPRRDDHAPRSVDSGQ